ncbi:MAG TPA: hypothetical protein VE817_03485, partial [Candidatus Acidoferrum sp.]|nr:hypothetical protein [Candidatus Acidoferrum sp.]
MSKAKPRRGGPFADPRFRRLVWSIVGILGWLGLIALGLSLFAQRPPRAGFDLTLILDAGRRVADGQSPYLAGSVTTGTQVEDLFYSYPPPVAQVASLVGRLSNGSALAVFAVLAILGFAAVAVGMARQPVSGDPVRDDAGGRRSGAALDVLAPALGLGPYVYPFAIALLFGNLDATFPFVYGAVLLAVSSRSVGWRLAGGVGLGLITVAKLHPGALLGWLAVRGLRDLRSRAGASQTAPSNPSAPWRRPRPWTTLALAIGAIVVVVVISLGVGGSGPWIDYLAMLRAGTGAAFSSSLNIGPASQLALALGDPASTPRLAPFVSVVALGVTALAAFAVRSTLLSFAIAAAASW